MMGFFSKQVSCPGCGIFPATKKLFGGIQCSNPGCSYFHGKQPHQTKKSTRPPKGNWSPQQPVSIQYLNFQGEQKNFTAESHSLLKKGKHLSIRVAPTGQRIALKLDKIQNLLALKYIDYKKLSRSEKQIYNYHERRRLDSPQFQGVLSKAQQAH